MPNVPPPPFEDARRFLTSTDLFRELAETALDEVLAQLEWLLVPGGEVVCRQGDEGDSLYLVASGRVLVVREDGRGGEVLLAEMDRGDTVGTLAVLTGRPRNATIRALRDSLLVQLRRDRAEGLLRKYPEVALALSRQLAGLLDPQPAERRRGCLALAVVAADGSSKISERLAEELAALGPTLLLDAARLDARFGLGTASSADGSAGHGLLTSWLSEQESLHSFLVYETDLTSAGWTRRCLRQADRVLVVAGAGATPDLGPATAELARLPAGCRQELVLLHEDSRRRPRDTAKWLGLHGFHRHHHLRLDAPGDLGRLARLIAGRGVGLVLGGGGARGFAHIGVIRALEEAGVPIDRIGGTSMGAVIAGLYARGYDWKDMLRLNYWGWVRLRPHKLYTLPLVSLLSDRKAERMLEMMFQETAIEDLWLSYFCVSTNLTRAEVVVHRKGKLRKWVGTSMRLPGIVPPVVENGDLLVDGGVLNNLPTDVMRALGDGPIIAVDVSASIDVRADPSYREAPTPWSLLGRRLRGGSAREFPNILELIHRSAVLASDVYAKQARREVELYLDLPVDGFDMFDVAPLEELAELGYRHTAEKLRETPWKHSAARRLIAT